MKCPKCGAANPDTAESCGSCGVRFRRMQTIKTHVVLKHPKEMKRRTLNRLVLLPLGVSLSVAIAAILVAVLLFSPWLSPLATVHDGDGDGHPDAYDFRPEDPELWAEGGALVVVMLRSEHTFSKYNYSLLVDGELRASGEIAANQTKVENIEVSFAIGRTSQTQVVLSLVATDGSAEQRQLLLENGNGYQANFTIPYSLRR
ncbi:MAG: zinc ribbon domain-containing protein [Methanomassiliicoccales archaeon]|nr:zinc ribbon domain-containing protein [Methanomassiliicoccales archaeon]